MAAEIRNVVFVASCQELEAGSRSPETTPDLARG